MPLSFATNGMMYGRYRLIERIGSGGMATVWRASDEALDREVAVKVFTATATTPEIIELQEREARTAASHTHHGLVTLLDAGVDQSDEHGDRIFLVMELIDGFDLKIYLENNPLTARDIAYIGHDVAEALEYLHHRGVVHRDIKPANILLSDFRGGGTRPRAKLTDFGIARPTDVVIPSEGTTTGTAAYLSPEQANLDLVGPPTDVYALGLVLLECFTRQIAFPGDAVQSALRRLTHDPDIPETLDPEWRTLLAGMTAREPKARPTATEAMLSLRDLVISSIGRRRTDSVAANGAPFNEASRLAAVRRLDVLDTAPEGELDRITALAARVLRVPVALISIVDSDRIWFKSRHGLTLDQVARDPGLCATAILRQEPWIIEDASKDPRASDNPLVMGESGLRFYAGVPLTTTDGFSVGTLCVLDFEPRAIEPDDLATLVDLAALAITRLEEGANERRASSSSSS